MAREGARLDRIQMLPENFDVDGLGYRLEIRKLRGHNDSDSGLNGNMLGRFREIQRPLPSSLKVGFEIDDQ